MDFILGTTDKTNLILWKLYNSNLFEVHERSETFRYNYQSVQWQCIGEWILNDTWYLYCIEIWSRGKFYRCFVLHWKWWKTQLFTFLKKSKILIILSLRTKECIAKYLHDQLAPPLYFQIQLRSTAGGQNSNVNMWPRQTWWKLVQFMASKDPTRCLLP